MKISNQFGQFYKSDSLHTSKLLRYLNSVTNELHTAQSFWSSTQLFKNIPCLFTEPEGVSAWASQLILSEACWIISKDSHLISLRSQLYYSSIYVYDSHVSSTLQSIRLKFWILGSSPPCMRHILLYKPFLYDRGGHNATRARDWRAWGKLLTKK